VVLSLISIALIAVDQGIGALALSFALPLRLSFTKSHRFAGVTPSAQAMLVLMHTVIATVAVVTLLGESKLIFLRISEVS
jgi:hypothetical protein